LNERERERKKEKRFSATTTRGAERIERRKNSSYHRKKQI